MFRGGSSRNALKVIMDCRVKPGNDVGEKRHHTYTVSRGLRPRILDTYSAACCSLSAMNPPD